MAAFNTFQGANHATFDFENWDHVIRFLIVKKEMYVKEALVSPLSCNNFN